MRTRIDSARDAVDFDLDHSLGFLINQLAKRMSGELNSLLARHGLTTSQWGVLASLWREDGLTQHELSQRSGIDAATLTEMLKRMTARGLVRRERDPDNNRYQRVYLTADSDTDLRDALIPLAVGVNSRALAGISASDRAHITTLLRRALANLDAAEGDLS